MAADDDLDRVLAERARAASPVRQAETDQAAAEKTGVANRNTVGENIKSAYRTFIGLILSDINASIASEGCAIHGRIMHHSDRLGSYIGIEIFIVSEREDFRSEYLSIDANLNGKLTVGGAGKSGQDQHGEQELSYLQGDILRRSIRGFAARFVSTVPG